MLGVKVNNGHIGVGGFVSAAITSWECFPSK
jgi:hypothetical protein